jgi:hypothetical protein
MGHGITATAHFNREKGAQAKESAALRRRMAAPTAPKPRISIAYVAGSGMPPGIETSAVKPMFWKSTWRFDPVRNAVT